jgi:hypothetical protein
MKELGYCDTCGAETCWIVRDDPFTNDLLTCFACEPIPPAEEREG